MNIFFQAQIVFNLGPYIKVHTLNTCSFRLMEIESNIINKNIKFTSFLSLFFIYDVRFLKNYGLTYTYIQGVHCDMS